MAESKVEIALIANARKLVSGLKEGERGAKRFFDTIKKHQQSLRKVAMVATAALAGQLYMLKKMADAAGVQEQAENDLRAALKIQGEVRQSVIKGLIDQAAALQKLTTFGDEEIIAAQALLVTYGVTIDKLEGATKATLDFAAATGRDLKTAALTVGKAVGAGFTAELSRYGIVLDTSTIPKTELATAVIEKMGDMFGGRAEAMAKTYEGRLKQLNMAVGDLKESIGFALIPVIMKFIAKIKPLVEKTDVWVKQNKELVKWLLGIGIGGTGVVAALATLGFILPMVATGMATLSISLGVVVAGFAGLAAALALISLIDKGLPTTIEGLNDALKEQEAIVAANADKLALLDEAYYSGKKSAAVYELEQRTLITLHETLVDRLNKIKQALRDIKALRDSMPAPTPPPTPEPGGVGDPGAGIRENIQHTKDWQYELVGLGATIDAQITTKMQAAAEEADASIGSMSAGLERYAADASTVFTDTIADFLVADQSFKKALTAATIRVVTFGLQTFIRAKIAEVTASMFTEKGKALVKAPLSFGASLLAIAPIAAAGAATIALLRAIKMPSFAMGGTVQRTGPAMVHEGEVIVNPRMPGKGQEALAMAGGGGASIVFNNYGTISGDDAVAWIERSVARAMRGAR